MNSYLTHFILYTFAMIGFIGLALFVYKKSVCSSPTSKDKSFLSVENSLKLSATKTVYVIKAGNEKFLIAGDAANTTMLAKLDKNSQSQTIDYINTERNLSEIQSVKKQVQRINRG